MTGSRRHDGVGPHDEVRRTGAAKRTPPAPVDAPEAVLDVYLRTRGVHPYGIADVVQLWGRSTWWVRGGAVAGVLDLPGASEPVLYAVTAEDPPETLALLADLAPLLPPAMTATGPRGMAAALGARYRGSQVAAYRKLQLVDPRRLPPPDPRVRVLGREDLTALSDLFATDPDAGAFFHAGLLDTGLYLGVDAPGPARGIVACAGVHVVEPVHGVAALGNVVTHPRHRRRGLARAVTGALCSRLLEVVDVVGLNVRERSPQARALYEGLGFATVAPYEEARLDAVVPLQV